jgi:phosphoglycolate phosphatase
MDEHGKEREMIKNVFFDLDGTLTDPKEGIVKCIQYSLTGFGNPSLADSELQKFIGPPLRATFKTLLGSADESLIEQAVSLYRERFSEIGIFENMVYPGIVDLLSALHERSIALYVVTSKPKIYAEMIINHFQLKRWFNGIYGPEMDGYLDNKSELVGFMLSDRKINPADVVIVGDRKEDIVAGKSNGIITIGVTYGFGDKQEIIESCPDYICNSPSDIYTAVLALI